MALFPKHLFTSEKEALTWLKEFSKIMKLKTPSDDTKNHDGSGNCNHIIKTRTATLSLRADNILQCDSYPHSEITHMDAMEIMRAQAVLAGGIKRPLLVRMGSVKSIDRAAREFFGSNEVEKNIKAAALVFSSTVGKVIGNFLIGLNKGPYPTRLFTTEEEAVQWLKEFL